MKISFLAAILLVVNTTTANSYEGLTIHETENVTGLMIGFPPSQNKVVNLENWQEPTINRWSFQNISKILKTAQIPKGTDVHEFSRNPKFINGITFNDTKGEKKSIFQMLKETNTDGFIVLQNGKIISEQYFNGMKPHTKHLLMSVSKSVTGTLAGIIISQGLLDPQTLVSTYIHELRGSAWGDATVRELLDMTVALKFSEDYLDPNSEVRTHERVNNWRPRQEGDPEGNYKFLPTIEKNGTHGRVFQYASANTDVLGWVLERATGRPYAELLSKEIWMKIGAEHDAYVTVDSQGSAFPNGGINTTLRDLARFGQMILNWGQINNKNIVNSHWVEDLLYKGDIYAWQPTKYAKVWPEGYYKNQWYVTNNEHQAIFAIGVHGQHIWIDYIADIVIVKFSSQDQPADAEKALNTIRAFEELGRVLVQ